MVTAVCSSFTLFDAKHESAKKKVCKNRFLAFHGFVKLKIQRKMYLKKMEIFLIGGED